MSWRWSGTSLLLLVGAGCLTACAVYGWRYRRSPTATSLVVVLAALVEWSVARAVELAAGDLATRRLFCDLKYVGLVALAPASIIFVLQYAGRLRRPSPVLLGLLAVEPLVVLTALAIPSTHHLFQTYLPPPPPGAAAPVQRGPLFWVHFVYFNVATWLCLGAFVVTMTRTSRPYRRQNALLLGSLALPLVAHLLTTLNVVPFGRVDLTRFAFLLTVVFMVLAVFRFHVLGLRPIARSRIFQTIGEGVVVLDPGGKVVDSNLAAERLLGQPLARIVGQPAGRVLPAWAGVVQDQLALGGGEAVQEIAAGGRIHEVRVSSLTDHLGWPTGQLVVARDVTERRRVEQQLRDSLEREQASTRHLRALDQMKSTFLQAVSHELRNPLASVLGIAVTLQRRHLDLDRDDIADLLHRLSRSARKMDRLLNDLLDLDRLAQPTVTPERECVDLGERVARAVKETTAPCWSSRTPARACRSSSGRRSSSRSARGRPRPRTRRAWGSGWRWCACSPSSTGAAPGSRSARAAAPRSGSTCPTPVIPTARADRPGQEQPVTVAWRCSGNRCGRSRCRPPRPAWRPAGSAGSSWVRRGASRP